MLKGTYETQPSPGLPWSTVSSFDVSAGLGMVWVCTCSANNTTIQRGTIKFDLQRLSKFDLSSCVKALATKLCYLQYVILIRMCTCPKKIQKRCHCAGVMT